MLERHLQIEDDSRNGGGDSRKLVDVSKRSFRLSKSMVEKSFLENSKRKFLDFEYHDLKSNVLKKGLEG